MVSKTYADYEPESKSSEMCKDCTMFRPPRQCSYVDGRILPEGWCKFFEERKDAA